LALDEPRADDEVFVDGFVRVCVDRGTYFYLDENLQIDFDPKEGVYRIRAASHVIPDKIVL
jgi:Fe-S cluster assembly iron-binding protein IscA